MQELKFISFYIFSFDSPVLNKNADFISFDSDRSLSPSPPRSTSKRNARKRRNAKKRLSGKDSSIKKSNDSIFSKEKAAQRAARFVDSSSMSGKSSVSSRISAPQNSFKTNSFFLDDCGDFDSFAIEPIEGTCTVLEKQYFRLTTAPDPSTVRPLHVLRKSLANIVTKWTKSKDYRWACDQLKSVRQDVVVQCIRNDFTVEVYETHAKIALEQVCHQFFLCDSLTCFSFYTNQGDRSEFNQCQSQLQQLYAEFESQGVACPNKREFIGYSILYQIFSENQSSKFLWLINFS